MDKPGQISYEEILRIIGGIYIDSYIKERDAQADSLSRQEEMAEAIKKQQEDILKLRDEIARLRKPVDGNSS